MSKKNNRKVKNNVTEKRVSEEIKRRQTIQRRVITAIIICLIGLILYITIPIVLGLIVVKAMKDYNGVVLIIVFGLLIILSVTLSIIRLIRYNKYKKNK